MREQFEKAEDEESKKKGKGKPKAPDPPPTDRKGKSIALMIRPDDGHDVDDAGLEKATLRLDLSAPIPEWEDSAEKDDEELYGDGSSA